MNALTQALKTAGIKTPSNNQRIWQWLKDNGMHTVDAVSKALGIQKQAAQAAMHDLLVRGMVAKHKRVDARPPPGAECLRRCKQQRPGVTARNSKRRTHPPHWRIFYVHVA